MTFMRLGHMPSTRYLKSRVGASPGDSTTTTTLQKRSHLRSVQNPAGAKMVIWKSLINVGLFCYGADTLCTGAALAWWIARPPSRKTADDELMARCPRRSPVAMTARGAE